MTASAFWIFEMKTFLRDAALAGAMLFVANGADAAEPFTRIAHGALESPTVFVERVLGVKIDAAAGDSVTEATWNGKDVIFAAYTTGSGDMAERPVVMLEQEADGRYPKIDVTQGEQEGGEPVVKAIGFANADRDKAQELIVLLAWPVEHLDVNGTMYEVRIFDDAASPAITKLTYLEKVSKHFEVDTCDCTRNGEPDVHFAFKTIARIKAELKKLGY
jgi:hypothetical protein